ncbi:ATP-binding protein [Halovenus sp. HT40]|uniref:ATP-binding protein n=1 Tax=Halovenus sp. HT40 TaxID=3126691 RepID=UPI00300F16E3
MPFIIGRGREELGPKPVGELGTYRALDGSRGASLYLDLNSPHAMLIVGKRGYGKSYTLGVVAEELARTDAIAPVVLDPMGAFEGFGQETATDIPADFWTRPTVTPDSLDPRSWCALIGFSPTDAAGALIWQAAQRASTLDGMREQIRETDADRADRRAAINHLGMAERWGIFDAAQGLDAQRLAGPEVSVLDLSGLADEPMNAVARAVAESLYQARVNEAIKRVPWLLVDEAHTFFQGVAQSALETILTRGRAPGVSTVLATQRPGAVSDVGVSQSDILLAHRLTAQSDVDALKLAQPTYMNESIEEQMPTQTGEAIIIDDATETVHAAQIRERKTTHDGESATAEEVTPGEEGCLTPRGRCPGED